MQCQKKEKRIHNLWCHGHTNKRYNQLCLRKYEIFKQLGYQIVCQNIKIRCKIFVFWQLDNICSSWCWVFQIMNNGLSNDDTSTILSWCNKYYRKFYPCSSPIFYALQELTYIMKTKQHGLSHSQCQLQQKSPNLKV